MSMPAKPKSVLRTDLLNVVGEFHNESDPRRDLEKQFIFETIGSSNYWKENEFLDKPVKVGSRKMRSAAAPSKGADLMEFRAAHGTSMLVDHWEKLCDEASRVGAITDGTASAAVTGFIKVNVKAFQDLKDKVARTWKDTDSADVNAAVHAVYDNIDNVLQKYFKLMKIAISSKDVGKCLIATQALGNERAFITGLMQPVLDTVGAQSSHDGEASGEMRDMRSIFMGLGGVLQKQIGVWKVGQGHIDDLNSGKVSVDRSRANFVTRDDFDKEFNVWNNLRLAKLNPKI